MNNSKISLYDTTLRDGTQGEGVSLSCDDKLRIARRLARVPPLAEQRLHHVGQVEHPLQTWAVDAKLRWIYSLTEPVMPDT